jgi:hypothetical protein
MSAPPQTDLDDRSGSWVEHLPFESWEHCFVNPRASWAAGKTGPRARTAETVLPPASFPAEVESFATLIGRHSKRSRGICFSSSSARDLHLHVILASKLCWGLEFPIFRERVRLRRTDEIAVFCFREKVGNHWGVYRECGSLEGCRKNNATPVHLDLLQLPLPICPLENHRFFWYITSYTRCNRSHTSFSHVFASQLAVSGAIPSSAQKSTTF